MIKKKIVIKLFILSMVLCTSVLHAQQVTNQMDLVDFLKSKYMGKPIYQKNISGASSLKLKIVNVIEEEDRYYAVLSNFDRVLISFQTSLTRDLNFINSAGTKKNNIDLNVLKTQELINKGIQKTLSQSSSLDNTSPLTNFEKNLDHFKPRNDFTTSKEVIYTDIKYNKEISDYFIVTYQGLFLQDGTQVMILIR
tara:strand:- start:1483 stop:2067 length:585 start_codon:yes stop_codon:yes gene_type:complete